MGNRGILHNSNNEIVKPWAHRAWVSCLPTFGTIKRAKPFSPGNYSELFFWDEATAFAAGHRPCGYCQRQRHLAFKQAWVRGNKPAEGDAISMSASDRVLHADRAVRGGVKKTYDAVLSELPLGTFFEVDSSAYLVSAQGYLPWSFEGYGAPGSLDGACVVKRLRRTWIVGRCMRRKGSYAAFDRARVCSGLRSSGATEPSVAPES